MSERWTFVVGDKLPIAEAAISIHSILMNPSTESRESWGGAIKKSSPFRFSICLFGQFWPF